MGWWQSFGFKSAGNSDELPEIYPMPILKSDFVESDVVGIYSKILTDVVERTFGINKEYMPAFWDNCLQSESKDGLVSLLAKAMYLKSDLFIVWDAATAVIRKADRDEEAKIKTDYEKTGGSTVGVFVSFRNYKRTDLVKLYSSLEYCSIGSLNKNLNLSTALQFKMSGMRSNVALSDSAEVISQAVSVSKALQSGKSVLIDKEDAIDTSKPDMTANDKAMDFINQRRAFYLGLPASYITGQAPKGLGDSGEGDAKAVERGLKNYYFSIIKPVVESVFSVKTSFKSEDFRQLSTGLEALKTFELIESEDLLSKEDKQVIIKKLFGIETE